MPIWVKVGACGDGIAGAIKLNETSRLKVLKEEIKKPYFIALKKFLWEEGVRGPDDIPKSLKTFPSRKRRSELHTKRYRC